MNEARAFFFVCAGLLVFAGIRPVVARAQAPTFITAWGTYGSGNGQLYNPYDVAVDASGNVYVVDAGNNRIQTFTTSGVYIVQWGTLGSGNGQFHIPRGVAVDASYNVYVADTANERIQKFGMVPTPAARETWGGVKSRYRTDGVAKQAQDK